MLLSRTIGMGVWGVYLLPFRWTPWVLTGDPPLSTKQAPIFRMTQRRAPPPGLPFPAISERLAEREPTSQQPQQRLKGWKDLWKVVRASECQLRMGPSKSAFQEPKQKEKKKKTTLIFTITDNQKWGSHQRYFSRMCFEKEKNSRKLAWEAGRDGEPREW